MSDDPLKAPLWKPRPVKETLKVYADWADSYDHDVTSKGYRTPDRIAHALGEHLAGNGPILDFGCGTGISGMAMKMAGIGPLHGTDISQEMLDLAQEKSIYDKLWLGEPGAVPAKPGDYRAIVAAGVVSLGAAPPETLDSLISALATDALLALSFNGPTLEDGSYDNHLDGVADAGQVEIVFRENGPHLEGIGMNSDVIILRRT